MVENNKLLIYHTIFVDKIIYSHILFIYRKVIERPHCLIESFKFRKFLNKCDLIS